VNNRRILSLVFSSTLCLIATAALLAAVDSPTSAQGSVLYVAPDGYCGGFSPCYTTIQTAMDMSQNGDAIHVATGTYGDIHTRPSPPGYVGPGLVDQIVYMYKTVTIKGGYPLAFDGPPDPLANPTVLDAQGQGRVLFITGNISPTIEGLYITGGDAAGLGGCGQNWDAGGGVYAITATITFSNNQVVDNTALSGGHGGGLFLAGSSGVLSNNTISANTAGWNGGGLAVDHGVVALRGNTIADNNPVEFGGGGVSISYSSAQVSGNIISGNHATGGGGVSISYSDAEFSHNIISGNTTVDHGAGIAMGYGSTTLDGDIITGNTAIGQWGGGGGGVHLFHGDATLTNVVIAGNHANVLAGGLYIRGSSPRLLHTTITRNTGGDGSGVLVTDEGGVFSTVALTNTILVSQTVGITVSAGSSAYLEATLWGTGPWENGDDWAGEGTIDIGAINLWGLPAFEDASSGDYHITAASSALDAGINAGIATDMDGDPRPMGDGYDIGADELFILTAVFTHSAPDWLGQTTVFTNTTVPTATNSYVWAFGDGLTTTVENPSHLYAEPGQYTVVLTATNQAVTDTASSVVTVYGPPAAGYDAYPTEGIQPLTVVFTNTTTTVPPGDPSLLYLWQFGDGAASSLRDPAHTYTAAGVYTVTLWTANAAGADALIRTGLVTVYEPVHAQFSAWPIAGGAPLVVTFTNQSTGDYTALLWDFGDVETSTLPNPSHTYTTPGSYAVTLWINGPGGTDWELKEGYITVERRYRAYLPLALRNYLLPPPYYVTLAAGRPNCAWTGVWGYVLGVDGLPEPNVQMQVGNDQGWTVDTITDLNGFYRVEFWAGPKAGKWFVCVFKGGQPRSFQYWWQTNADCDSPYSVQEVHVDWQHR
jgi:PKD repeat protein